MFQVLTAVLLGIESRGMWCCVIGRVLRSARNHSVTDAPHVPKNANTLTYAPNYLPGPVPRECVCGYKAEARQYGCMTNVTVSSYSFSQAMLQLLEKYRKVLFQNANPDNGRCTDYATGWMFLGSSLLLSQTSTPAVGPTQCRLFRWGYRVRGVGLTFLCK
jgi:hypothetical protein